MGCGGCFGFSFARKTKKISRPTMRLGNYFSQELLLPGEVEEDGNDCLYNGDVTNTENGEDGKLRSPVKRSEEIILYRTQNGLICREFPVKKTHRVIRTEVLIMKMVEHPNIVNLIEVIDDPTTDHFYMVLEYVEGKWVCEGGSSPPGGLGENTARKYLRDVVSGLMYLYAHNIVHGDNKPDNLLVTVTVKMVLDDNDELRRSPGAPVFSAPECCLGLTYHGKAADTWAVGVTLYCMVLGNYPFLGDSLQDAYEKIVNNELLLPDNMNPMLKNLIQGLLCKVQSMPGWLEKRGLLVQAKQSADGRI